MGDAYSDGRNVGHLHCRIDAAFPLEAELRAENLCQAQAGEIVLVVIGVLCSAISVYYYLRVLVQMYMRDPAGATPAARVPVWSAIVVAAMVVLTLQIGVLPARMVAAAKKAMTSL